MGVEPTFRSAPQAALTTVETFASPALVLLSRSNQQAPDLSFTLGKCHGLSPELTEPRKGNRKSQASLRVSVSVAGTGLEPVTPDHEPGVIPFHYPAKNKGAVWRVVQG